MDRPQPAEPEKSPQFIGQYRIDGVLGRGGMGCVYRATHSTLERPVALKLLPPECAADPTFVSRFLREARLVATLRHDHIVQVHDAGCADGRYYIAMELVEGQSLAGLLDIQRRIPEKEGLRMLRQTALGLAAAHEKGLVHRDIKPENLLLDSQGELRIADFGLALESSGVTRLTAPGATVGTPLYMSPEQADGAPADERSDLYSLGATFYHVFAGRPPFEGANVASLLYKHQCEAPADPRLHRSDLSDGSAQIVLRLLAKRPEGRPASAQELLGWLDRLAAGKPLPVTPRPAPLERRNVTPDRRVQPHRSSRLVVGIVAAAIVFVLLLVAGSLLSRRADQQRVQETLAQARLRLQEGQPERALVVLTDTAASVRPLTEGMRELLALLEQAREEVRRHEGRQRLDAALAQAVRLCGDGKPRDAVKVLDEVLVAIPADTPGRADAETARTTALNEAEVLDLKLRQHAFTTQLFSEDWKACQAFVLPDDRMKLGAGGIEFRLGVLRGLALLIKMSPDTIRIDRVVLSPDRTKADVFLSLKLNNEWKEQKPSVWRRKENAWFLHLE